MKKIIRILGVGAFVLTIFMNANATNGGSSDLDLVNLLALNSANAECPSGTKGVCRLLTNGTTDCLATYEWSQNDCK